MSEATEHAGHEPLQTEEPTALDAGDVQDGGGLSVLDEAMQFEEELAEPDGTTRLAATSNRITGRITRCGRPAVGARVEGVGILTVGIEDLRKPCAKSTRTRRLGSTTVGADGTYTISYEPSPPNEGFCAYSARVRIDVFDGRTLVWRSPEQTERPSLRLDRELHPDCSPGQTGIVVIDSSGSRVAGAEVFHNGAFVGRTDANGAMSVASVAAGDRLVARRLLNEHATDRGGHAQGSTRNWSHRTYGTSLRVLDDGQGDNVDLRQTVVTDPTAIQRIQLSSLQSLIGFNLLVSIEWDATAQEIRRYTDRLLEMSELLYNATDGQFLVERVTVVDNRRSWDEADIRIYANLNQHSVADVGAVFSGRGRIHMNPYDSHEPSVTLHELGHYAFNVHDEYKPGPGWKESDGPHQCTFASQEGGTDFSAGGSKDSCLMRGARNAEIKKICSTHPDNPHATTTQQGLRDCWSEILERYGDPRWRLRPPVSRGVILDRFPNSGVPLTTTTAPPSTAGAVASHIPVQGWKPQWQTSSVDRAGECQDLIVRTEFDGVPRDGVSVSLESGSLRIYQGVTKDYGLPYGVRTATGEITIRGAHVGDRITAFATLSVFPSRFLRGSIEVDRCSSPPLIVNLEPTVFPFRVRLDPIGPGEMRVVVDAVEGATRPALARVRAAGAEGVTIPIPAAARSADASLRGRLTGLRERGVVDVELSVLDEENNEITLSSQSSFASLWEDDLLNAFSADGRLELFVPAGSLEPPIEIVIETAMAFPSTGRRLEILGDAYRVASSRGDRLRGDATVEFHLDTRRRPKEARQLAAATIVRLGENGTSWEAMAEHSRSDRHVGARTARLGTFALAVPAEE